MKVAKTTKRRKLTDKKTSVISKKILVSKDKRLIIKKKGVKSLNIKNFKKLKIRLKRGKLKRRVSLQNKEFFFLYNNSNRGRDFNINVVIITKT